MGSSRTLPLLGWLIVALAFAPPAHADPPISSLSRSSILLPWIMRADRSCSPIPGVTYGSVPAAGPATDRPAAAHPDLNLAIRGYALTSNYRGLIDLAGDTDPRAPQLGGLFAPLRRPVFTNLYRVYDWDWAHNRKGDLLIDPPVTLVEIAAAPEEIIYLPASGYHIWGDYQAFVLYATPARLTLKYTREDNVVWGYTIHVENICVEPSLLRLYQQMDRAGRGQLPALRSGQPLGRAWGANIGVAIRDTGRFMDPRSRRDWWRGFTQNEQSITEQE